MANLPDDFADEFDPRFNIFHELMARKVKEILLVSTLYDAWIMEEDCRLSERIMHEYRGLNLSHPPRLTRVSSAEEALLEIDRKLYDIVITMPQLVDMDVYAMGRAMKRKRPELPVILLSHSHHAPPLGVRDVDLPEGIDQTFIWSGNTEILLALIKSVEDRLNVAADTRSAGIRVILLVEDSPFYLSSILPILYREMVSQTQALIEEGLTEEHRLLTMRARPKILTADSYERALACYQQLEPNILGVISDVRFPRAGQLDGEAGVALLQHIHRDRWDIPLLLMSSEPSNARKAAAIPATFIDKNSPSLHREVRQFFLEQLGFGPFVFRMPDGRAIERVTNLRSLEQVLAAIPDDAFLYHWNRNDFSRWLFARTEIVLASKMRPATADEFEHDVGRMKAFLLSNIRKRRQRRQKGVVVNFDRQDFDPETDFFKIGTGSLGGKARGLAFFSTLLWRRSDLPSRYDPVEIVVSPTLVITTDVFEAFVEENDLKGLATRDAANADITAAFRQGGFADGIVADLKAFLRACREPLAIRSSSLLEDAKYRAYAGLYRTEMIPNDHPDIERRLQKLLQTIKVVYASTYFAEPKAFARRVGHRTEEEKMAVIVQRLVGSRQGDFFYPSISGVARSYNYYPFERMQPEEGIASIALGLGKMVTEDEQALRFSPAHPQLLPQFSKTEDILANAQREFYALAMGRRPTPVDDGEQGNLVRRSIDEALAEPSVKRLCSTYIPEDHRIRDSVHPDGQPILTFAPVLKYESFPLARIIGEVLKLGQTGMGCHVELEFAVDLDGPRGDRPRFAVLQLRPMTARAEGDRVAIDPADTKDAFCFSMHALGNTVLDDMTDILYVKPDRFDPAHTRVIAGELQRINARMAQAQRKYLLIGPGRWGSADRWLGIPVTWADISAVGAIVETYHRDVMAEPSQGSHFFHNITSLGISYITIAANSDDYIDWPQLRALPVVAESSFVAHAHAPVPFSLKVDGARAQAVIRLNDSIA
jgi:CheY-like chemotaxis protein